MIQNYCYNGTGTHTNLFLTKYKISVENKVFFSGCYCMHEKEELQMEFLQAIHRILKYNKIKFRVWEAQGSVPLETHIYDVDLTSFENWKTTIGSKLYLRILDNIDWNVNEQYSIEKLSCRPRLFTGCCATKFSFCFLYIK